MTKRAPTLPQRFPGCYVARCKVWKPDRDSLEFTGYLGNLRAELLIALLSRTHTRDPEERKIMARALSDLRDHDENKAAYRERVYGVLTSVPQSLTQIQAQLPKNRYTQQLIEALEALDNLGQARSCPGSPAGWIRVTEKVIVEGVSGYWHYHVAPKDEYWKSYCGAATMPSGLDWDSWGEPGPTHFPKRYTFCKDCERHR